MPSLNKIESFFKIFWGINCKKNAQIVSTFLLTGLELLDIASKIKNWLKAQFIAI